MTRALDPERSILRRRIITMRKTIGLDPWTKAQTTALMDRLNFPGDGITDPDLRVMVRLYNREIRR